METLIEENVLLVEAKVNKEKTIKLELELPFYGKVPNERRWIRITKSDPPEITTITLNNDGCDVFHWYRVENVSLKDFVPCNMEDWISAKYIIANYCINLKNR